MEQRDDGPKLKEPDVFTGRDPAKLAPFISQCIHWFLAKPRRYTNDRDQVLFAASYLRDLASTWWMPIIAENPLPAIVDSWDQFSTEIFQMFGDQHLQSTAQTALLNMKMKDNTRVSEYLVSFNSHAPFTGWNDVALAGHFYRGLPDRIKDMFQLVKRPQTFVGMRQFALEFDQRYWERQAEAGVKPHSTNKSSDKDKKSSDSAKPQTAAPATNSARPAQQTNRPAPSANAQTNTAARPPQSSTTAPRPATAVRTNPAPARSEARAPLTQEEKDRRRANGLCLYCGKEGHGYANCPNLPSNRTATGRAVYTFTTTETVEEASENSEAAQ
jgi:hypothetical protein